MTTRDPVTPPEPLVDPWPDLDGTPVTPPEPRLTPHELWTQAEGDRDRYLALMREHGHIVPGKREPGEDIFGHPVTDARPLTAEEEGQIRRWAALDSPLGVATKSLPLHEVQRLLATLAEARALPSTPICDNCPHPAHTGWCLERGEQNDPCSCRVVVLPSTTAFPERWIESLHEGSDGLVWTTKAELLAALPSTPTDRWKPLRAGTGEIRRPSTPTDPQRFSLEPYATDALVPDPDGEWVRYRE